MKGAAIGLGSVVAALIAMTNLFPNVQATASGGRQVVIEIRDFEFHLQDDDLMPGDIIVWRNLDIVPHTVTSKDDGWDSGSIAAGGEWRTIAGSEMNSSYFCRFHPSMVARLDIHAG